MMQGSATILFQEISSRLVAAVVTCRSSERIECRSVGFSQFIPLPFAAVQFMAGLVKLYCMKQDQ
jgi:hypothetical protein